MAAGGVIALVSAGFLIWRLGVAPSPAEAFWNGDRPPDEAEPAEGEAEPAREGAEGNGVVVVDFRSLGPEPAA